jgi:hypothetical protein
MVRHLTGPQVRLAAAQALIVAVAEGAIEIGPTGMVIELPSGSLPVTTALAVRLVDPDTTFKTTPTSPAGHAPGVIIGGNPKLSSTGTVSFRDTACSSGVVTQSSSTHTSTGTFGMGTGPTLAEIVFVSARAWPVIAINMTTAAMAAASE